MRYAWRNLIRIPTRTVIMLVVLLTVMLLLMWSVLTASLCTSAINSRLGDLDGTVKITDGNARIPAGEVPTTLYGLRRIADNFDIIQELTAYAVTSCDIPEITPLLGTEEPDEENRIWYTHKTYLCTEMAILPAITDGRISMVAGTPLTMENDRNLLCKVVLSETLAKLNGLSLGDSLTLHITYRHPATASYETVEQEFVIGGIYRVHDASGELAEQTYQIAENDIYIPLSTYSSLTSITNMIPTEAYFRMEYTDEKTVDRLENRLRQVGQEKMELIVYSPENVTQGISKLLMLARITSVLLAVCGLIAFLVMLTLNLQSRTRELGVLTALGKPYSKITNSFFCEIVTIALIALVLTVILFALTVGAGADIIRDFLISDAATTEQINTSSASVQNQLQLANAREDIFPSLIEAVSVAVLALSATITATYFVIRTYLRRLDVLRVLGGNVG